MGNTEKSCLVSSQSNCAIHQNKSLPYNKVISCTVNNFSLRTNGLVLHAIHAGSWVLYFRQLSRWSLYLSIFSAKKQRQKFLKIHRKTKAVPQSTVHYCVIMHAYCTCISQSNCKLYSIYIIIYIKYTLIVTWLFIKAQYSLVCSFGVFPTRKSCVEVVVVWTTVRRSTFYPIWESLLRWWDNRSTGTWKIFASVTCTTLKLGTGWRG